MNSKGWARLLGVTIIAALAHLLAAQQQATIERKITNCELPRVTAEQHLRDQDFLFTLQIVRTVVTGQPKQTKEMFEAKHVSLPRFESLLRTIYLLAAERRMEQHESKAAGLQQLDGIQDLGEVRKDVARRLEAEFGGRGRNYQEARALVDRQGSAADEIVDFVQGQKAATARKEK